MLTFNNEFYQNPANSFGHQSCGRTQAHTVSSLYVHFIYFANRTRNNITCWQLICMLFNSTVSTTQVKQRRSDTRGIITGKNSKDWCGRIFSSLTNSLYLLYPSKSSLKYFRPNLCTHFSILTYVLHITPVLNHNNIRRSVQIMKLFN